MRIALVVEKFDDLGGGVERAVWQLARCFHAHGDEVHVIARTGSEQPGITLHRLSIPTFWQPLRVWRFSQSAAAVIAKNDFDVVHSFSRTRFQDIFHAGGGSHAAYLKSGYGPIGALLRRFSPRHRVQLHFERLIVADSSQKIQCVSEMVRREFEDIYGLDDERLFVVPYGVDLERFSPSRPDSERQILRREFEATHHNVWLLPGSGFKRKGLITAMEALALSHDPSARLWVAGKDEPRPWIRRARAMGVESRIQFLGRRDDMERVYAAADGVILPSRYDAGALVCLETAASGRPLITTAHCGPSELLAEAGRVVSRPDDAAAFAAALNDFASVEKRQEAGMKGRQIAENHSWNACSSSLRSAYLEILELRKASSPNLSRATSRRLNSAQ